MYPQEGNNELLRLNKIVRYTASDKRLGLSWGGIELLAKKK